MNSQKAKFILSAYRPGHEDREDPEFREALEFVGKDTALKEWFDDQIAFDKSMVATLREVPVPDDLHANILAGARVSVKARPAWRRWVSAPAVSALAAALVIGLFLAVAVTSRLNAQESWKTAALATLTDMSEKRDSLDLKSRDPNAIHSWIAKMDPGLLPAYPVSMEKVGAYGCKEVRLKDGLVAIVCFEHDGKMFHLASYHVPEGAPVTNREDPIVERDGKWLLATWASGEFAHMLITGDESVEGDELLEVIRGFAARA